MIASWLLLCGGLSVSGTAVAETDGEADAEMAIWSSSMREAAAVSELDVRLDEGRALYSVCSECHLPSGAGQADGTMPQLAGQHRSVLIKQMMDIRSGIRRNAAMYPYVASLETPQELADVAGYIEGLPIPGDNGRGAGESLGRGKKLYSEHCESCHGASGEGRAEAFYPKLQGQHYRYLIRQLIDIAGGRRGNANPAMVEAIADFSARDVASVADYVSRIMQSTPATSAPNASTTADPAVTVSRSSKVQP